MQDRKLGLKRVNPKRYATVPRILDYAAGSVAPPLVADSCDYTQRMGSAGGALGNNDYGCCGFAALGHLIQSACANLGIPCDVTTETVLSWYSECTGFKPSDPSTDQGVYLIDALNYFVRKGLILGYGRVDLHYNSHVARALELFGGLYTGFGLPVAWQNADEWDVGPETTGNWLPYGWGGHAIGLHSYDGETNAICDTWGEFVRVTSDARDTYCDEAYAVILPQWFDSRGATLQGFDLDGLRAKLTLVD